MISYYPQFSHLINSDFSYIGGNSCGIMTAEAFPVIDYSTGVYLKAFTGEMPFYHKLVFGDPSLDIKYHISGYGLYNEESFVKFIGESIERYSAIIAPKLLSDRIVYDSYDGIKKRGITMPLKYIEIFTKDQQGKISKSIPWLSSKRPKSSDTIGWIQCYSLINPGEKIWFPAQMLFVGYNHNMNKSEKLFVPSFSTGNAAHVKLKKALLNAILEYIHIDAFMVKWYAKLPSPKVKIDDDIVISILKHMKLYKSEVYDVIPLYLTLPDVPIPVFGIFLRSKDNSGIPHIVFGVQSDVDTTNGIVRGTMEAASIISPTRYNALVNPDIFYSITENSSYSDLDTNVFYFASPIHKKKKDNLIQSLISGEINLSSVKNMKNENIDFKLEYVINILSGVSKYAAYYDITPPEVVNKGWHVIKVIIPELLGMCLPGFPYKNHPRILKYGGVKNEQPHPLP